MKKLVVLFMLIYLFGCSKVKHRNTTLIINDIYFETYKTYDGGVYGEATISYITDSNNFRKKIGYCDEKEGFLYSIIDTSNLKISKYSRRGTNTYNIIDSFILNIKDLKNTKKMERISSFW